ncbi:MAG: DUF2804 domain-containing protein [Lachnospiraceae bacterium]
MRNHEVVTKHLLLSEQGVLIEPGWSRKLIQTYNRNQIRASRLRIKEWDYYLVLGKGFGVAFTIADNGYMGLISVSLLNFKENREHTQSLITPFPMGRLSLPPTSERGDISFQNKRICLEYTISKEKRHIYCVFKNFYNGKDLNADIILAQPNMDSMVIATPWKENKTAFYYNQKINCMPASGAVYFDNRQYSFQPKTDFGTLDWGRGVWTYDNRWYWGSGNGIINRKPFGFNIGYGFGDTTAATENLLFYDYKAHKLDDVTFHIPKDSYMNPWKFTSSDGRFEMDFNPVLDRAAKMNVLFLLSDQHQVFGKMSGKAILDDGTVLEVNDLLCFAEDVHNKY